MSELRIDVDSERVVVHLGKLPAAIGRSLEKKLRTTIGPGLKRYMQGLVRNDLLKVRTGTAARSIFWRLARVGKAQELSVGADLSRAPYMRIQDLGGRIVPKRAAHLTIPIGAALTASGVPRFTARELIDTPEAFGYQGTFVAKDIIFGKNSASITPLFVLSKGVTLKGVGFRRRTIADKQAWVRGQMEQAISPALSEGRG